MTFLSRLALVLLFCLSCLALTGCPDNAGAAAQGHGVPRPKEPPLPGPARDVPIDPALQAAAKQELFTDVKAQEPALRAHAMEGIRTVFGAASAQEYLAGLNDTDPIVRFTSAMALGELKIAAGKAPLMAMLNDADALVRVAVRFGLHRLGDTTNSHDLERSAADPSARVRTATATVLGKLGEPSAIKILRRMRADQSAAVRQQAAESLWRLGDEQGLADLIGLTESRHPDDEMIGLLGLTVRKEPQLVEHVRACLTAEWVEVQLVAARAMGMIGPRPEPGADPHNIPYDLGYVIATNAAQSSNAGHRQLAAFALGAIGRRDSQDVLRKLLKDPDADVRIAAATAILQVGQLAQ